nr:unnamed protein product [Digitaria exilis]
MRKLVSSPLTALLPPEMAAAAAAGGVALALRGWWEKVNGSPAWQDGAFFSLSAAYALVSAVALGVVGTFLKGVHDFLVNAFYFNNHGVPPAVRAIVFGFHAHVFLLQTKICIWAYLGINDNPLMEPVSKIFISAVSFIALLGFLIYGGRLFVMLRHFPIESKGRRKKLYEVIYYKSPTYMFYRLQH